MCSSTSQYAWSGSRWPIAGRSRRIAGSNTPRRQRRAPCSSDTCLPDVTRQPCDVLAEVVEQEPRLALECDEAGQALELVGVEGPVAWS